MDASRTIYGRQIDFKDRGFKIFNFQTVQTYPYNCIGAIYYQNTFGEMGIGTGFLIGPDLVLTSAHNVCSREAGQHNNMKFYPGVSGDFEEAQVYEVANFRIPNQYLTSEQSQRNHFNYALLKLNSPIEKAAYVELVLNYTQQSDEIGISGYRRDAHSESSAIQFALWKSQAISIIHSPLLSHKLSTFEGNSGSPILAKREGKVIAVGIHRGASGDLNEARLITNDLAVDLLSWEREMAFFKTSITFNELQGKNHLIPLQKREIISKFPVKVNLANSNRSELVSKFKAPLQSTRKQQQASVVSSSGSTSSLLTSIVIFNDFCKDIEQERRQTFISKAIEYSLQSTVKDLLIRLEKVYENEGICKNFKRYPPRLWLINERIKTNELFSSFKMACKMNPTFDYKLYVQGQLLKAERQLNEYTITGSSLLLVEFRQSQTWMLFNQAQILNACCPYCRVLTDLPVMCSCKVIIYCSEKCKEKDAFAHKKRCPIIQQK